MPQHIAVKQAKDLNKAMILAKPNVVGVGVGYKKSKGRLTSELSVIVLVKEKIPLAGLTSKSLVPREIGDVSTDVIQVGEIRALQSRTDSRIITFSLIATTVIKATQSCSPDLQMVDRLMSIPSHILSASALFNSQTRLRPVIWH
jgi:hypothetical protein